MEKLKTNFFKIIKIRKKIKNIIVQKYFLLLLYMEFITDYVTITKPEHIELLKIKAKYDALIKRSILFLSNNNIYCRLCNVLSKNNSNIENHIFKEEL